MARHQAAVSERLTSEVIAKQIADYEANGGKITTATQSGTTLSAQSRVEKLLDWYTAQRRVATFMANLDEYGDRSDHQQKADEAEARVDRAICNALAECLTVEAVGETSQAMTESEWKEWRESRCAIEDAATALADEMGYTLNIKHLDEVDRGGECFRWVAAPKHDDSFDEDMADANANATETVQRYCSQCLADAQGHTEFQSP